MISCILLKFIPNKTCSSITWFSKYSFQIYLAHILILFGVNFVQNITIFSLLKLWYFKYLVVLGLYICTVIVMQLLKKKVIQNEYN